MTPSTCNRLDHHGRPVLRVSLWILGTKTKALTVHPLISTTTMAYKCWMDATGDTYRPQCLLHHLPLCDVGMPTHSLLGHYCLQHPAALLLPPLQHPAFLVIITIIITILSLSSFSFLFFLHLIVILIIVVILFLVCLVLVALVVAVIVGLIVVVVLSFPTACIVLFCFCLQLQQATLFDYGLFFLLVATIGHIYCCFLHMLIVVSFLLDLLLTGLHFIV